jgi:hypothetical protein
MLAVHLDNILFLLFVAIAILFQILTRAASKARRRSGPRPRSTSSSRSSRPLTPESDQSDEERIRKFLEALGQPSTSNPPAPIQPRPTYQKPVMPPPMKSPLPPLTTRPADLPREIRLPQQIPPTRAARTFRSRMAEAPAFEVHDVNAPLQSPPVVKTAAEAYAVAAKPVAQQSEKKLEVAAMLKSTSGLREAVILREIFGPPRSLQPLDLVGSV